MKSIITFYLHLSKIAPPGPSPSYGTGIVHFKSFRLSVVQIDKRTTLNRQKRQLHKRNTDGLALN